MVNSIPRSTITCTEIIITSILFYFALFSNITHAEEIFNRKGFNFALGASVLHIPKNGDVLPGLDIETGYAFSNKYDLSLSLKVSLGTAMLSSKGKYYLYDKKDTPFISAEIGQFGAMRDVEKLEVTYAGGIGYAFGKKELELILIWDRYHDENIYYNDKVLLLSYRYLF